MKTHHQDSELAPACCASHSPVECSTPGMWRTCVGKKPSRVLPARFHAIAVYWARGTGGLDKACLAIEWRSPWSMLPHHICGPWGHWTSHRRPSTWSTALEAWLPRASILSMRSGISRWKRTVARASTNSFPLVSAKPLAVENPSPSLLKLCISALKSLQSPRHSFLGTGRTRDLVWAAADLISSANAFWGSDALLLQLLCCQVRRTGTSRTVQNYDMPPRQTRGATRRAAVR